MINKFCIIHGVKYFCLGIFQNYVTFIPAKEHIKYLSDTTRIYLWKSNRVPEENIENITKSDSNFPPTFVDHHVVLNINFDRYCLINNIYVPEKAIN